MMTGSDGSRRMSVSSSSSSSSQRSISKSSAGRLPSRPPRPSYNDLCMPASGWPSTSKFAAPTPTLLYGGSYRGMYLRSYTFTRKKVSAAEKVMRLLSKLNPFSRKRKSGGVNPPRLGEKKRKKEEEEEVVVVESGKDIIETPRRRSLLPLPPRLQRDK